MKIKRFGKEVEMINKDFQGPIRTRSGKLLKVKLWVQNDEVYGIIRAEDGTQITSGWFRTQIVTEALDYILETY